MGKRKNGAPAEVEAPPEKDTVPAPAPDPNKPLERRRFKQGLPVALTHDELEAKGAELSALTLQRETVKALKKDAASAFKSQIDGIESAARKLADCIKAKKETREVECIEYLLPTNEVQIIRSDTSEVVDARVADKDDLQEALFEPEREEAIEEPNPGGAEPAEPDDSFPWEQGASPTP